MEFEPLVTDDPEFTSEITNVVIPKMTRSNRSKVTGPLATKPNLREIARYGGYPIFTPPGNVDPFVYTALKSYDNEFCYSLKGKTRKGDGVAGMYRTLDSYSRKRKGWNDMSPAHRSAFGKAIAAARKEFTVGTKVHPLDWENVGAHLRLDTSAGVSWPGKKKGEVLDELFPAARWLGHRMKQGGVRKLNPQHVQFPPCLGAKRGHLSSKKEKKTRLVWLYPAEMLCVEGLYAPLLYKLYEEKRKPLLVGDLPGALFSRFMQGARDDDKLVGLDFSKFDSSVPAWLIRVAFDILHAQIDWESWKGKPCGPKERLKWRNVWDGMVWYFINTPILMPDGRMWRKYAGIPSGSWFTQLIGSIVNYILVHFVCNMQDCVPRDLSVLGDDSAFKTDRFNIYQAKADLADAVNMQLSDKSDITRNPSEFKLLGTTFKQGRPSRSTREWFELLLYPESPPRTVGESMTRFVGLWLTGAMFDTGWCSFFEYFQSGYLCPARGYFSRDQQRWLSIVNGNRFDARFWSVEDKTLQYLAYSYVW